MRATSTLTPRIARRYIFDLAVDCEIAMMIAADPDRSDWRRSDATERAERYANSAFDMSASLAYMTAQKAQQVCA